MTKNENQLVTIKLSIDRKRNSEILNEHELNFLRHLNMNCLNESSENNREALITLQGKLERAWKTVTEIKNSKNK